MNTYLETADDKTMLIVQIEHVNAVNNIDQILDTPGLDGICIGPNDLSGSYGVLGKINHPDVQNAIDIVIAKVKKTNLFLGVATYYEQQNVKMWIGKGVQFIALNTDYANLYRRSKEIIDDVKSIKRS